MNLIRKCYHSINYEINKLILKHYNVNIEPNYCINGRIYICGEKGRIIIGDKFHCNSGKYHNPIGGDILARLVVKQNGKILIGNNVGLSNTVIVSDYQVTIEDDVLIGGGVKIYDTDFHSLTFTHRMAPEDIHIKAKPILIKQGAFIGAHSIILKGVIVGKHSIIGAGSVVTGIIPDYEIWAGNPAKFIKKVEESQ